MSARAPLRCWEEIWHDEARVGPYQISPAQVRRKAEVLGEPFAPPPPGARLEAPPELAHWIVLGALGQATQYSSLVCVRSESLDVLEPLYADEPFYVVCATDLVDAVDQRMGIAEYRSSILVRRGDEERVASTMRINTIYLRRGHG